MEIWALFDGLAASGEVSIDRPRGTAHPRFPAWIYPVDYGYFVDTNGGDGEGIDVFRGRASGRGVVGLVATFDPHKRDAEVKVLLDCDDDELALIEQFYDAQPQGAELVRRTTRGEDR